MLSPNSFKTSHNSQALFHELDSKVLYEMNWGIIITAFMLMALGLVNLYSASSISNESGITYAPYFQRQMIWTGMGFFCLLFCAIVDYHLLDKIALPFYIFVIILLILVHLIGFSAGGAKRWIDLGFMSLQPSEFAKFAVLIMGAKMLAKDGHSLGWTDLFKVICMALLPFALVVTQPDLGTALMLLLVLGGMVLYHGIQWKILRLALVFVPLALPFTWFFLKDYQKQRILTFLDPSQDPRGAGYHIIQSQIAIGSGELTGKGFQEGTQSQLRFLPEKHTDFAIAVLSEEWGFVGALVAISLFCLFLFTIFCSVRDSKDRFGSLLCTGIFFYFFCQILINIGMVIGIMPVVGMPLPFISYGGSAMLVNCVLVGIVFNVSIKRSFFKN